MAESSSTEPNEEFSKKVYKVIVIGDSNVGKTCLIARLCSGKFPDRPETTIGVDFCEKYVSCGEGNIRLQLWDTAGQERFRRSMINHYYRNAHAVVFVYDISRPSSFENLPRWIEESEQHNVSQGMVRVLIGNKCDVVTSNRVPTSLAQEFADCYRMPLFETSAKEDCKSDHVESIFITIAHKLKHSKLMTTSASIEHQEAIRRLRDIEQRAGVNAGSDDSSEFCSC